MFVNSKHSLSNLVYDVILLRNLCKAVVRLSISLANHDVKMHV